MIKINVLVLVNLFSLPFNQQADKSRHRNRKTQQQQQRQQQQQELKRSN